MGGQLGAHASPVRSGRGRACDPPRSRPQLLQHLKRIISDLCKLYNLPQHPDVEMLDQPLPAEQVSARGGPRTALPEHLPRGSPLLPLQTRTGSWLSVLHLPVRP